MEARDALDRMLEASGQSRAGVSISLGRHRNFIASGLSRGSWNPTLHTLASIAEKCGYHLVLESDDERIAIDV